MMSNADRVAVEGGGRGGGEGSGAGGGVGGRSLFSVLEPTERDKAKILTTLPHMVPSANSAWSTDFGSPLDDEMTTRVSAATADGMTTTTTTTTTTMTAASGGGGGAGASVALGDATTGGAVPVHAFVLFANVAAVVKAELRNTF